MSNESEVLIIPNFDNLSSLNKYLEKVIMKVLQKEVLEAVKDEMIESIEENVYDKYDPTLYVRKKEKGGLIDRKNIKGYIINGRVLVVKNERKSEDSNKDVIKILESGTGYDWVYSNIYKMQPYPRPFMKPTVYRLTQSGKHITALIKGLQQRGLNAVKGT